jgi:hypothetical protein
MVDMARMIERPVIGVRYRRPCGEGRNLGSCGAAPSGDNCKRTFAGMKALLRLFPLLVLTACGPSSAQEQDMTECHKIASKRASVDMDSRVRSCMNAKGYHFMAVLEGCGGDDPYGNARCYAR